MIFIVVKFRVRPERSQTWLSDVAQFTEATRGEPGNLFFDWSRSVDDPRQFVLLEAFRDSAAGGEHVRSEHFQQAVAWMPTALSDAPEIVNVEVPGTDWSRMSELQPAETR